MRRHALAALWLQVALPACALRSPAPTVACRTRRQILGALVIATAAGRPAAADDLVAGWEAGREANLARMRANADAKEAICVGRRAIDMPNLSPLDMTFDPPCYVSGYYELIAAAAILGAIKLGQVADEEKRESDVRSDK